MDESPAHGELRAIALAQRAMPPALGGGACAMGPLTAHGSRIVTRQAMTLRSWVSDNSVELLGEGQAISILPLASGV